MPAMLAGTPPFLVHHMDGGIEGEEVDEGMGGSREMAGLCPRPLPGAGQHLPGLVQTLPNPASPHCSCPCEHDITGGAGGDLRR